MERAAGILTSLEDSRGVNIPHRLGDIILIAAAPSPLMVTAWAVNARLAHGRREARSLRIVDAPGFAEKHDFPGVAAIAEVTTWRGNAKPRTRLFCSHAG
ncbi:MAG: hypothetical protein Q8L84_15890 [Hyphomonas sp.]|nr:hypothetical protein [Hyphomonas sp.]